MYRVSTVYLNADASDLDPPAGTIDRGELSAGELVLLLERFLALNLVETGDDDPYIEVLGRSGKFHVRTSRGRLFLYNARDIIEPYAELSPAEIILQLDRESVTAPPFSLQPEPEAARSKARFTSQRGIAAGILAAGVLLNAYTIYSATRFESINEAPAVTLLSDTKEIAARQSEVAGTYVTGDRSGDRVITIWPDGRLKYSEIGRPGAPSEVADTYKLGRIGKKLCLVTADGSVIDVTSLDAIVYYRDKYRRKS
jgi:hypothetical protein